MTVSANKFFTLTVANLGYTNGHITSCDIQGIRFPAFSAQAVFNSLGEIATIIDKKMMEINAIDSVKGELWFTYAVKFGGVEVATGDLNSPADIFQVLLATLGNLADIKSGFEIRFKFKCNDRFHWGITHERLLVVSI